MAAAPRSESDRKIRCWRCEVANPPAFFCAGCGAIQSLPSDSNYSSLLGFGGGPVVDRDDLQARYYDLSRKLHPDRFVTGSPEEQRISVQATALLNDAFRTLKDTESRGRWWLRRQEETLGRDNNRVPPELAMLVFDIQEKIERLAGGEHHEDQELRTEMRAVETDLTRRMDDARNAVETILREWPHEGPLEDARSNLKRVLSDLSYLRTLTRDVRASLGG